MRGDTSSKRRGHERGRVFQILRTAGKGIKTKFCKNEKLDKRGGERHKKKGSHSLKEPGQSQAMVVAVESKTEKKR